MPNHSVILLVEDNPSDMELVQRAVKEARLSNPLKTVTDAVAAMDYLLGSGIYADRILYPLPFLVLLDLRLPTMSGLELLEWIRKQPGLEELLVVVLTASSADPDIGRAYALGAKSYLMKPDNFEQLVLMMKNLECYWLMFQHGFDSAAA